MKLANSFCDNAPSLFQVWYIRALFIKQQDLILSIEVTAYTSAGQQVRHVAGSGEVYRDFGTAMEISVVTVSAYGSSGSNTQIMMRVVSLEEELLVHRECPLKRLCAHSDYSVQSDGMEHGGRGFRAGRTRLSAARMANFKGIVQASTTCGDRRRQSCCLRFLACPFCVCSVRPESPWTGQKNCRSSLTQRRMLKSPKLMLLPESVDARVRYRGRFL